MFRPDLHRLEVFCAVVDEGSLSKASRRLFMSQPAISAHIKSLQQQLGMTLFHRVGRRSVVSKAGEVLYQGAGDLLAQADDLRTLMSGLKDSDQGRLHLGMSLEWEPLLPAALGKFKCVNPYVEVLLTVDTCDGVENLTIDRHFDIGFIARPADHHRLESICLVTDEIVPVAMSDHRLASHDGLRAADLRSEMIFVRESGSTSRDATDRLLDQHGLRSQIALEAASHQTITATVAGTSGIGMLPRSCLGFNGREDRLVVLDIPELMTPLNLHVVYLPHRMRSEALERFLELVCDADLWTGARALLGQADTGPRTYEYPAKGLPDGAAHG